MKHETQKLLPIGDPHQSLDYDEIEKLGGAEYIPYIERLRTPEKLQSFIDLELRYNYDWTRRSLPQIVEKRAGHCFEVAIGLAYPILQCWGYEPRLGYINAYPDSECEDHAVTVYRTKSGYGTVGYGWASIGWRDPTYPTYDAVMQSFDPYYVAAYKGRYQSVMRGYTDPVDLVSLGGTDWFFRDGDNALEDFWYHCTDNTMCTAMKNYSRYKYPTYTGQ